MLIQSDNLAGSRLSYVGGGSVFTLATARTRHGWSIANARAFGSVTSYPQGYNSPSAIKMPLKTSGNISVRFAGNSYFSGTIDASGVMAATMQGEGTLSANAQMGASIYATLPGEGTLSATVEALGNMAANLDAGARPSAFDVAQEVWQSQATAYNAAGTMGQKVNAAGAAGDPWSVQLEGTFTAADLLRIASAVLAGKVSGMETGNPVFRSIDDAEDRVSAVSSGGNRTSVILNGG